MSERIEEIKKSVEEQCRKLECLRAVMEGEGDIGELRKRVNMQCKVLGSLEVGLRGEGFALSWPETRQMFLQYIEFKKYNQRNARCMVSYIDRFVKEPIRAPLGFTFSRVLCSIRACWHTLYKLYLSFCFSGVVVCLIIGIISV
ncbi:MAG: hypothetical protein ACP5JW_05615 [Candidatus Bathyarchaeia archaeon]